MRIALVTRSCPLAGADGIARQRQVLARALARLGHDVHVFTIGDRAGRATLGGAVVHSAVRSRYPNPWFPTLPVLDWPLTDSQILWESVERQHERAPFDVIDVPFWLAQGSVLLERTPAPVVVWLQTTTRHLIQLAGREPRAHERVLLALETRALARAEVVLGDSHAVLADVQRLYGLRVDPARACVVWPGLDDGGEYWETGRPARKEVEILVVGRLEQRKGTPELLEALPAFLAARPHVHVTFVGADNSGSDGFKRGSGRTYPESLAHDHPELADRVRFLGRVPDQELFGCYKRADMLLHAARYESFGMVFLEAMRAGLPTVAFEVAGASEVHDRTTARLVPAGDWPRLLAEVDALASDRDARLAIGCAARARFERTFSAEAMAARTIDAYRRAARPRPASATARPDAFRIFQVTEALQYPDGVGHIIRSQARLLTPLGGVTPIQTIYVQSDLAPETGRVSATAFTARDAAVLHFYGYSRLERFFASLPARRIVHYHNITPPEYFPPASGAYEMTTRGLAQLPRLARLADIVTGDSEFNVRQFAASLPGPRPTMCLYPLVDRDRLLRHPIDRECFDSLVERRRRNTDEVLLMFVGRLAPNKRQDLVVSAAGRLAAEWNRRVRLVLIGSNDTDPVFRARVDEAMRREPHLAVDLPGGVPDERLYAYYRVADAFVSASEHEGFGIPLAEAMAFGVPVVAAALAAVPETLGDSGVLVTAWDDVRAAEAVAQVIDRPAHREEIVRGQYRNLDRFSEATLRSRLEDLAVYLRDDRLSPAIVSSDVLLSRYAS